MRASPPGTYFTGVSTNATRIKCLAKGHNILMPGFESSTSVSRNRHSDHMTNVLRRAVDYTTFHKGYCIGQCLTIITYRKTCGWFEPVHSVHEKLYSNNCFLRQSSFMELFILPLCLDDKGKIEFESIHED